MSTTDRVSLRSAYLYLVCLVTLVLAVFAGVNLVRGVVELAYPDAAYVAHEPWFEGKDSLTDEERAEQREAAADAQRRHAVLSVVGDATMLLVAGPVYLYHWRRVRSEQPERSADPAAA